MKTISICGNCDKKSDKIFLVSVEINKNIVVRVWCDKCLNNLIKEHCLFSVERINSQLQKELENAKKH